MRKALYLALYEAQGRACYCCDKYMSFDAATRDHVTPRARNGSAGLGNILLAHRACNQAKADRAPTQRELKRIETTLAALDAEDLRAILASAVNTLEAARAHAADAVARLKHAEQSAMVVMRFAPTADAARLLAKINPVQSGP